VVMIVHPRKLHWTISLWATFGCLPHIHTNVTLVNILYVNKGRGALQYHNSSSTSTKALSKKLHLVIHKSPIKKVTPRHPQKPYQKSYTSSSTKALSKKLHLVIHDGICTKSSHEIVQVGVTAYTCKLPLCIHQTLMNSKTSRLHLVPRSA